MKKSIIVMLFALTIFSLNAQAAANPDIKNPEAPCASVEYIEIDAAGIDPFVEGWNAYSENMAQSPGFMTATLYRSVLPDHKYQLIAVEQFQSYAALALAHGDSGTAASPAGKASGAERNRIVYRPVASQVHTFNRAAAEPQRLPGAGEPRVAKIPGFANPEAPFVFINLFEIADNDVGQFVSDWKRRSQLTSQQPGSMFATVYKSVMPDQKYQLINISQWQSYNAYVDGQNASEYSQQLEADLARAESLVITRGFFRPVASHMRYYPELLPAPDGQ